VVYDEADMLRAAHAADRPILGICFGGQLLADSLGGSAQHAAIDEIGWFRIDAPTGATNPVGPGPWFEWHHDCFTAPPQAQVLAQNDRATQLFRMGTSVGTQFHPEVDVNHITGFLNGSEPEYLQRNGIDRRAMLAEAAHHESAAIERAHRFVDWFLDDVAFG